MPCSVASSHVCLDCLIVLVPEWPGRQLPDTSRARGRAHSHRNGLATPLEDPILFSQRSRFRRKGCVDHDGRSRDIFPRADIPADHALPSDKFIVGGECSTFQFIEHVCARDVDL